MSQANDPKPESVEGLKTEIDKLKEASKFYQASKLLQHARIRLQRKRSSETDYTDEKWWQTESAKDEIWIVQQLALCTYKNEEIPARKRLDQAMALLEEIGLRNGSNTNTETLCLGGAIHKYKWQQFGQAEDLHESLSFYLSAFTRDPHQDMGYGGINAAFILDLLADRASRIAYRSGTSAGEADHLKKQASALRQQIIEKVSVWIENDQRFTGKQRFWHQLTLAEAHFGLGEYEQANKRLQNANVAKADEWKRRTVFMQLRACRSARYRSCTRIR